MYLFVYVWRNLVANCFKLTYIDVTYSNSDINCHTLTYINPPTLLATNQVVKNSRLCGYFVILWSQWGITIPKNSLCQSGLAQGQARPGPRPGLRLIPRILRGTGADLHENALFIEKRSFSPIWAISGPSRPQKWIRLEIPGRMVVSRGPWLKIEAISWPQTGYSQFCDITTG